MSGPEVRIDQLTGGRVLIAPGRAGRPVQFESRGWTIGELGSCQFCEGSEAETPPELDADLVAVGLFRIRSRVGARLYLAVIAGVITVAQWLLLSIAPWLELPIEPGPKSLPYPVQPAVSFTSGMKFSRFPAIMKVKP